MGPPVQERERGIKVARSSEPAPADVGPATGGAALGGARLDLLGSAAVPDIGMSRSQRDGRGKDEGKGQEENGIPELHHHRFLLGGNSAFTRARSGTAERPSQGRRCSPRREESLTAGRPPRTALPRIQGRRHGGDDRVEPFIHVEPEHQPLRLLREHRHQLRSALELCVPFACTVNSVGVCSILTSFTLWTRTMLAMSLPWGVGCLLPEGEVMAGCCGVQPGSPSATEFP